MVFEETGYGADQELVSPPLGRLVADGIYPEPLGTIYHVVLEYDADEELIKPPLARLVYPEPVEPTEDVVFDGVEYGAEELGGNPPLGMLVENGVYPEPVGTMYHVVFEEVGYGGRELEDSPPLAVLVEDCVFPEPVGPT